MLHPDWAPALADYAPSALLLAFSGGRDSVALLDYLARQDGLPPLEAVHIHHGWSPEADAWLEFCRDFAAKRNIPFRAQRVRCARNEAAAREARYAALEALLPPRGVLLTAHHADDQLETFAMNWLRGSGLDGLSAMPFRKRFGAGEHWRPLLLTRRQRLENHLLAHHLPHVDDASNDDPRFLRRRLRAWLPGAEDVQSGALDAMLRSIEHLQQSRAILDRLWREQLAGLKRFPWQAWRAERGLFFTQQALWFWLRHMVHMRPPRKRFERFILDVQRPQNRALLDDGRQRVQHERGEIFPLETRTIAPPPPVAPWQHWPGIGILQLDAAALDDLSAYAWRLYPWDGRFQPLGARHAWKLKDYFQRRGIGVAARRRLPMLCRGRRVLWLAGENSAEAPQLRIRWQRDGEAAAIS